MGQELVQNMFNFGCHLKEKKTNRFDFVLRIQMTLIIPNNGRITSYFQPTAMYCKCAEEALLENGAKCACPNP